MIIEGEIYRTASGKSKQRGQNDRFRLVPETQEEAEGLEQLKKVGRLASFTGSAHRGTYLSDLRNTARAIDPGFKEDIRIIAA